MSSFSQNEISLPEQQTDFGNENSLPIDFTNTQEDYVEKLAFFSSHPIDLNSVNKEELESLYVLNDLQIESFFKYKEKMGDLIDMYELQSIPLWDLNVIQKLIPIIIVKTNQAILEPLYELLKEGNAEFLCRVSEDFNKQNALEQKEFLGSPQHLSVRFKKSINTKCQFGVSADKDAGEQLFNRSEKNGFDFYSAHFFKKGSGVLKTIAAGDFSVNIGQGLIKWQSMAFGKGSEITMLKRQSQVLKPYCSFGENNFERGLGLTIGKNKFEATFFASCRKIDANITFDSSNKTEVISSVSMTGLHRTSKENSIKGNNKLWIYGGCLTKKINNAKFTISYVYNRYDNPILKSTKPYNLFSFSGQELINYGSDYNVTIKNMHAFGEVSFSNNDGFALSNGVIASVSRYFDISLHYRHFSKNYWSLNSNAVAENTSVNNEKGLLTGLIVHARDWLKISAYADNFTFPWLKYNSNSTTYGQDYFIQTDYQKSKKFSMLSRYKIKTYNVNGKEPLYGIHSTNVKHRQNWRTQFEMYVSNNVKMRSRVEFIWISDNHDIKKEGALFVHEIFYKPLLKPISGNVQLAFFDTEDYETAIYGYESDIRYSNTMVVYYNKGVRFTTNIGYKLGKNVGIWIKWASTSYFSLTQLPAQQPFNNNELKFQIAYHY